jgi:hypothetical protein
MLAMSTCSSDDHDLCSINFHTRSDQELLDAGGTEDNPLR